MISHDDWTSSVDKKKGYAQWDVEVVGEHHYYTGRITAPSFDEQNEQNVLWEVMRDGWQSWKIFGKKTHGHCKTVRLAMKAARRCLEELKLHDNEGINA